MGKMEIQKTIIPLRGSSLHLMSAFISSHVTLQLPLKYLKCKDGVLERVVVTQAETMGEVELRSSVLHIAFV